MFSKKGDASVAINYSSGNLLPVPQHYRHGLDAQAAYSPLSHVAITYSYMYRNEKDVDSEGYLNIFDSSSMRYTRRMQEFGVGTYLFINRAKDLTLNLYGGYGTGSFRLNEIGIDHNKNPYTRLLTAQQHKWYAQAFITFIPPNDDHFRASLGGRIAFVNFSKVQSNYTDREAAYFDLQRLSTQNIKFYEPAVYMQYKVHNAEWLSLNFSFGASFHFTETPSTRFTNGSFGIGIDPVRLFKRARQ